MMRKNMAGTKVRWGHLLLAKESPMESGILCFVFMMPPMYWYEGKLGPGAGYQRQYIDSAQRRLPTAPRLTALQIEALDLFDALLDDPSLHLSMRMRPGDFQFCYNHTLLHDRCAFTDHALGWSVATGLGKLVVRLVDGDPQACHTIGSASVLAAVLVVLVVVVEVVVVVGHHAFHSFPFLRP